MEFGTQTDSKVRGLAKAYTRSRRTFGATSNATIAALAALESARARKGRGTGKSAYLGRLQRLQRVRSDIGSIGAHIYVKPGQRTSAASRIVDSGRDRMLNRRIRQLEQRLRGAEMALVVASTKQPTYRRSMGQRKTSNFYAFSTPKPTVGGAENANGTTFAGADADTQMSVGISETNMFTPSRNAASQIADPRFVGAKYARVGTPDDFIRSQTGE